MFSKRARLKAATLLVAIFLLLGGIYYYVPTMFADDIYPLEYASFIVKYSQKYGVDPALVAGVILQESRFNPQARSSAGAQGLMQFMPGTAATMAKETGRWPNYNIFDAETSVEFGAAHIRDLLIKYNGNVDLALYAYNTGTGSADKYASNPAAIADYSYVKRIKNYRTVYATMYASQLSLEPVKLEQKDNKAEVRGFIWSRIFTNFVDELTGTNK